jgi:hypothetical protein
LKKIFLYILPFLILSILVFVYLYAHFLLSNAAFFIRWSENEKIINDSLETIFTYKLVFWLLIINLLVFTIILLFRQKYKHSLILFIFIIITYIFIGEYINKKCASYYFEVFLYQRVPESAITEPLKDAGYNIGPFLNEYIIDKNAHFRRYAINGISKIDYTPAIPTLKIILYDSSEVFYIKDDVISALYELNTKESKIIIEDYYNKIKDNKK